MKYIAKQTASVQILYIKSKLQKILKSQLLSTCEIYNHIPYLLKQALQHDNAIPNRDFSTIRWWKTGCLEPSLTGSNQKQVFRRYTDYLYMQQYLVISFLILRHQKWLQRVQGNDFHVVTLMNKGTQEQPLDVASI